MIKFWYAEQTVFNAMFLMKLFCNTSVRILKQLDYIKRACVKSFNAFAISVPCKICTNQSC